MRHGVFGGRGCSFEQYLDCGCLMYIILLLLPLLLMMLFLLMCCCRCCSCFRLCMGSPWQVTGVLLSARRRGTDAKEPDDVRVHHFA